MPPHRPVLVDLAVDGDDGDDAGADGGLEGALVAVEGEVTGEEAVALGSDIDGDEEEAFVWPVSICGAAITHEDRWTPAGVYQQGFRIVCPIYGLPCRTYRSRHLDSDVYGRLAPIFFLGAWV